MSSPRSSNSCDVDARNSTRSPACLSAAARISARDCRLRSPIEDSCTRHWASSSDNRTSASSNLSRVSSSSSCCAANSRWTRDGCSWAALVASTVSNSNCSRRTKSAVTRAAAMCTALRRFNFRTLSSSSFAGLASETFSRNRSAYNKMASRARFASASVSSTAPGHSTITTSSKSCRTSSIFLLDSASLWNTPNTAHIAFAFDVLHVACDTKLSVGVIVGCGGCGCGSGCDNRRCRSC
mmetsp:Transcript_40834/g.108228  ORF Transcript_40834/g.108228 Transcript_40834/m.108228 type:complete len:239 (-) Transcript_40834:1056-1772(-)